jgi:hypothetical protein
MQTCGRNGLPGGEDVQYARCVEYAALGSRAAPYSAFYYLGFPQYVDFPIHSLRFEFPSNSIPLGSVWNSWLPAKSCAASVASSFDVLLFSASTEYRYRSSADPIAEFSDRQKLRRIHITTPIFCSQHRPLRKASQVCTYTRTMRLRLLTRISTS